MMLQCLLEEQKGFLIKILNIRTSHTENKGFLKELITILLENSCVEIYSHFPKKVQQHFLRKWFDEKFEHGSDLAKFPYCGVEK